MVEDHRQETATRLLLAPLRGKCAVGAAAGRRAVESPGGDRACCISDRPDSRIDETVAAADCAVQRLCARASVESHVTRAMEFSILGPLDVRADGQTISTGASKEWALLTLLLLNADRVVPVDRLVDEL